jgi:hypothetical protein
MGAGPLVDAVAPPLERVRLAHDLLGDVHHRAGGLPVGLVPQRVDREGGLERAHRVDREVGVVGAVTGREQGRHVLGAKPGWTEGETGGEDGECGAAAHRELRDGGGS